LHNFEKDLAKKMDVVGSLANIARKRFQELSCLFTNQLKLEKEYRT
jgi:hypothetical protein